MGPYAKGIALGVLSGFVFLMHAAGASAALPVYASHATTVSANGSNDAASPCTDGRKVVGGGVFLSGSSLETEVKATFPYDAQSDANKRPDDGWYGIGNAGPTQETLTTYSICANANVRYASATRQLNPGQNRAKVSQCPRGTKAISGGVRVPSDGSPAVRLMATGRAGRDAWSAKVANGSTSVLTMKVWAICADVRTRTASAFDPAPTFLNNDQDNITTPDCSSANYAVTGIAPTVIGAPTGTEIASLIPEDLNTDPDDLPDDGGRAWFNNQSGTAQRMSIKAFCAKL